MIVYLDSNIIIYVIENHPVFGAQARSRLARIRAGGDEVAASDASRLECLVLPYRNNDLLLLASYATFFNNLGANVYSVTAAACERGAQIQAAHRFKGVDSLHLALAVENGCGLFLTADAQLARFPDVPVEIL